MDPKKDNIKQYMIFSGGINGDGVSKYKEIIIYIFLTKYIKSFLWRVAVCLSYIYRMHGA